MSQVSSNSSSMLSRVQNSSAVFLTIFLNGKLIGLWKESREAFGLVKDGVITMSDLKDRLSSNYEHISEDINWHIDIGRLKDHFEFTMSFPSH